jgi:Fe2+ or Zn2+ uptake regulation protein
VPIPADSIRQLLKAHGLRPSAKRFAILTILANAKDWTTCEEIAGVVASEWPTMERASVSQCLCQLVDTNVVELSVAGEGRRFRLVVGEE